MGFVGWGAGSFATSYILSLTPSTQNNKLVDNQIMQQCLIDVWANTTTTASAGSAAPAAPATTATPAQSTIYITPVVTTTLGSAITAITETGATSTLDWSTITAELGTGTSEGPLVTATKASTLAGTQKVNSNITGTTNAADSLLTATGSQNLTSAATIVATSVPTGAGVKAMKKVSGPVIAMASAAFLLLLI